MTRYLFSGLLLSFAVLILLASSSNTSPGLDPALPARGSHSYSAQESQSENFPPRNELLSSIRLVGTDLYPPTCAGIQAASGALPQGGQIWIPPGVYSCGPLSLTVADGVELIGIGNDDHINAPCRSGAVISYVGPGTAVHLGMGSSIRGICVDISGAGPSSVAIDNVTGTPSSNSFMRLERVWLRCPNTTKSRGLLVTGGENNASSQHNWISQLQAPSCRLELRGASHGCRGEVSRPCRVTTTIMNTVSAHSYVFVWTAAVSCVNCTTQASDSPEDHIKIDHTETISFLGGDIEGNGTDAFDIGDTTSSFQALGTNLSGFSGSNPLNGNPLREGLFLVRGAGSGRSGLQIWGGGQRIGEITDGMTSLWSVIDDSRRRLIGRTSGPNINIGETAGWREIKVFRPLVLEPVAFDGLPFSSDGAIVYCSDCSRTNPCTPDGSGAIAKRIDRVWICD